MVQYFRLCLTASIGVAILAGCESTPSTSHLETARLAYEGGRYESAYQKAHAALKVSRGSDRHDAAYMIGLSAYRLDKMREAETNFSIAAGGADEHTAGSAKAMLGLMRLDQDRHIEAARFLRKASTSLTGTDARQAAHFAAQAYEAMGDSAAADTVLAVSRESTPSSGATIRAFENQGYEFSLQAGAFRERARADRTADILAPLARKNAIGPVRVIPQHDDRGREIFLVQIGHFNTRQEASRARTILGRLELIVTAAVQGSETVSMTPAGYH